MPAWAELEVPRDSIPEDHLAWFDLRGPVSELTEYDYYNYGKTIWRFDKKGRLTEYIQYTTPFFQDGGCVFGLWAHYRYAYNPEGKIIFLETYYADYNTVDEWADSTLQLFPPQIKEKDYRAFAEREYGDTTRCYSLWTEEEKPSYHGVRYDHFGNRIEDVWTDGGDRTCANVRVRNIKYYKDIELFDLPVGVRTVSHQWTADGRQWGNQYDFDQEGNMTSFHSWVGDETLYEWNYQTDEQPGCELIEPEIGENVERTVSYWSSVAIGEMKSLPTGVNEENAFYLCFNYMGYAFEGALYPLHDNWWIVLSHWCLDEMDDIYIGEDENGKPIPASSQYRDPFAGMRYPIIRTDSVSFSTRNYSGQTIPMYSAADSKRVWDRLKVQCSLDVLDADVKTRRLLCRSNPNDWMWGTPLTEEEKEWKHPYVAVYGWVDEQWTCANLLTTCP